jgi:hypothetical protein
MYLSYTYYISNNETGQFYYGSRFKNVSLKRTPADDLWIYYFTSSKYIKEQINEYGKSSFTYKVLLESENYDHCYWYEQDLIKLNIDNKLCLNKFYIDNTTMSRKFSPAGIPKTEADKRKMSIIMAGKSPSNKGKITGEQTSIHRTNISNSMIRHYNTLRENGISLNKKTSFLRKRLIPYDVIIDTVNKVGFKLAAIELNVPVVNLRARYHYAINVLKR